MDMCDKNSSVCNVANDMAKWADDSSRKEITEKLIEQALRISVILQRTTALEVKHCCLLYIFHIVDMILNVFVDVEYMNTVQYVHHSFCTCVCVAYE